MKVYVFMVETDSGVDSCDVFSTREAAIEMLNEIYKDYMAQLVDIKEKYKELTYEDTWVEDDWVEIEYRYEDTPGGWTTYVLSVRECEVL